MADAKKPAPTKGGEKKPETKSTAQKVVDAVKSTAKAVTEAVTHPKEALKHAAQSALDKVAPGIKVGPARKVPALTTRGRKRTLTGFVRSDKMDKTVVVEVTSLKRDPVYGKYLKDHMRYKAHDEKNEYKTGDKVEIREHRPLSRDKRWIVSKLITRAKVE